MRIIYIPWDEMITGRYFSRGDHRVFSGFTLPCLDLKRSRWTPPKYVEDVYLLRTFLVTNIFAGIESTKKNRN